MSGLVGFDVARRWDDGSWSVDSRGGQSLWIHRHNVLAVQPHPEDPECVSILHVWAGDPNSALQLDVWCSANDVPARLDARPGELSASGLMRFARAAKVFLSDEWSADGDLFVVPRDITLIADVQDAPGCMIVVNDKEYLVLEKASSVSARLDEVLR